MIRGKRGALSGLTKSPLGKETFDSLLERDYMLELENTFGVKRWTKEHKIKIPYYIFGIKRNYLPDFLVEYQNGDKEIHETKGVGFLSWLSTHNKRLAGDKFCKENSMIYRFIENSNGATFINNNMINVIYKDSD